MQGLILAAGKGERMLPLTKNIPKCLVKYKNKCLIDYCLNSLKSIECNIIGGYKADCLKKYKNVILNENYNKTGMVYSMFCFQPKDDVLVTYSDIIYNKNVIELLQDSKDPITIICDDNYLELWNLRMNNPIEDLETLKIDEKGYVKLIGQKPKSLKEIDSQYTGIFKINKEYWDVLKEIFLKQDPNIHMTNFFNIAIENSIKIKTVKINKSWMEFDTISDLKIENYLPDTFFESKSISKDSN